MSFTSRTHGDCSALLQVDDLTVIGAENRSTAPTWDDNVVKDNWRLGPTIQIGLKNQFIPSLNMDLEENMFASVLYSCPFLESLKSVVVDIPESRSWR